MNTEIICTIIAFAIVWIALCHFPDDTFPGCVAI